MKRQFVAPAPERLWVVDLSCVSTWSGFACVGLAIDADGNRIVGWRVVSTMAAMVVLDVNDWAVWVR
jgi:putative transposase